MRKAINKITLFSLLIHFGIVIPVLAGVIQMEREEVIQRSELIFVGAVLEKQARWNDQGNLIVTDYIFRVDEVLFGKHEDRKITLTFAGGQLPEEGQSVSDVPEFKVGEVVLLMIEESATPLFSPVTGMYQGKYTAVEMQGYSKSVAFDGRNLAVKDEGGQVMYFEDFIEIIRNEIPVAKSKPLPDRSVPQNLQKYIIEDLPALRYDPLSSGTVSDFSAPETNDVLPEHPLMNDVKEFYLKSEGMEVVEGGEEPRYWAYSHRAKSVPIVYNPWPSSFAAWLRNHDQFAMSYWNAYADIFRVMTSTGSWAWQNNRYDMAGFPDNQTMIDQFGQGWGSTTLAICWLRWDASGFSIEADIACNPAFSWTTDDYSTYNNPNLYNLDRTLTHELGHSWGLEHQWYALSVMNYAPKKYRAYNVLYGDDCMAVRSAFPAKAVDRSDLGVALFYSSGYQDYDDSNLSTQTVAPGGSITVSDFIIENSGTVAMTPEIRWYLVPTINSWSGSRYLGTTTHGNLNRDTFFKTSRTLTVPSSVPSGNYYLGAYVGNSTDNLGDNNSSWLDRLITVLPAAPNAPTLAAPANGAINQPTTLTLDWNVASGAVSYRFQVDNNPDFSSPVYNQAGIKASAQQISGLANNTTYYWRVNASNAGGTSPWSTIWNFTTIISAPDAPKLAAPKNGAIDLPTTLTLEWNDASRASYYRLQVATNSSFRNPVYDESELKATSQKISGLANNTTYYWRVSASNVGGSSPWSEAWRFKTIIVAPDTPTLVSPKDGATEQPIMLTFNWNAAPRAASYRLQVDIDSDFTNPVYDKSGLTATSQKISGLTHNTTYYWRVNATNAGGVSPWSDVWNFITTAGEQHFTWRESEDYYPILVNSVTFDGQPIAIGDEVGVFFRDDNENLICGGGIIWDAMALNAWGNDSWTPEKDGFADGEKLDYRLWVASAQEEFKIYKASYTMGDGLWGTGAYAQVDLAFVTSVTINIDLEQGWNWISSNVYPPVPAMDEVWSGFENLEIVKGYEGFYIPDVINSVGDWDIMQMYAVNLTGSAVLEITGEPAEPTLPIELHENWNWVSYLPEAGMDAEQALESIVDYLNIAKSYESFYIPGVINGIGDMIPGKGYKLHVSQECILSYPESGENAPAALAKYTDSSADTCQFYTNYQTTEDYHAIVIRDINIIGGNIEPGDELGVFSANGLCVGGIVLQAKYPLAVMAWLDNQRTEIIDGAEPGDQIEMRFWKNSTGLEYRAKLNVLAGSKNTGESPFAEMALEVNFNSGSLSVPTVFSLDQNYPNPFNPITTIQYGIIEPGNVSLIIYGVDGQVIRRLVSGYKDAGFHKVVWDGTNGSGGKVSSGVYLYILEAGKNRSVRKMVLVK